ncbi:hypothetical protein EDC01DRAFT_630655 [Geopyxis carbonaria]|nr:hypothetical protein EDC01DRAFT_630655 [Geopyxis carbonaria]
MSAAHPEIPTINVEYPARDEDDNPDAINVIGHVEYPARRDDGDTDSTVTIRPRVDPVTGQAAGITGGADHVVQDQLPYDGPSDDDVDEEFDQGEDSIRVDSACDIFEQEPPDSEEEEQDGIKVVGIENAEDEPLPDDAPADIPPGEQLRQSVYQVDDASQMLSRLIQEQVECEERIAEMKSQRLWRIRFRGRIRRLEKRIARAATIAETVRKHLLELRYQRNMGNVPLSPADMDWYRQMCAADYRPNNGNLTLANDLNNRGTSQMN